MLNVPWFYITTFAFWDLLGDYSVFRVGVFTFTIPSMSWNPIDVANDLEDSPGEGDDCEECDWDA